VQKLYRLASEVGFSISGHLVVQDLRQRQKLVGNILIFNNLSLGGSADLGNALAQEWAAYRANVAPQAQLYLFDLAGHGTTPLEVRTKHGEALIAGWPDKVFDVLAALENGESTLAEIEKTEL
jgi:hypothetical protein